MDLTIHLNILRLLFLKGFLPTLKLIPVALFFSVILGIIGGVIRTLRIPVLDKLILFYIGVMRGTPTLLLLFISYFVLPTGDDPFYAATFALVLCHGAYMTEIVRGGLESVKKGQSEAAKSLGLSFIQRMYYIILPQAVLVIVPAVVGQLIILIKDTALASVIGYVEITRMGRNLTQTLFMPLPIFLYIGIYYFILCHSLKILANRIENYTKLKILGTNRFQA